MAVAVAVAVAVEGGVVTGVTPRGFRVVVFGQRGGEDRDFHHGKHWYHLPNLPWMIFLNLMDDIPIFPTSLW